MKNPNYAKFYNSAVGAYNLKQYNEALIDIEKAVIFEPSNYQALHAKGLILKKLNRLQESSNSYGLSIQFCKDENKKDKLIKLKVEVDSLLSDSLIDDLIDLDFSQETSVTVYDASNESDINELGLKIQELLDEEKYSESIKYINQVLALHSDSDLETLREEGIDQYYLAKAYSLYHLEENSGLEELLQTCLEINPNNEDAKELLNQIFDTKDSLKISPQIANNGYLEDDLEIDDDDDVLKIEDSKESVKKIEFVTSVQIDPHKKDNSKIPLKKISDIRAKKSSKEVKSIPIEKDKYGMIPKNENFILILNSVKMITSYT